MHTAEGALVWGMGSQEGNYVDYCQGQPDIAVGAWETAGVRKSNERPTPSQVYTRALISLRADTL